jgi:DtxR family Mn-dependent transcriptional regulator
LDALLGFPTHDPHGDPIPDKDGNVNTVDKILLSTFNKDESGVCVGVNDSSSEFLRFLDKKKITLGKKITVLEKEDFDDSLSIEIDGEKLSISKKIANNLYIKK